MDTSPAPLVRLLELSEPLLLNQSIHNLVLTFSCLIRAIRPEGQIDEILDDKLVRAVFNGNRQSSKLLVVQYLLELGVRFHTLLKDVLLEEAIQDETFHAIVEASKVNPTSDRDILDFCCNHPFLDSREDWNVTQNRRWSRCCFVLARCTVLPDEVVRLIHHALQAAVENRANMHEIMKPVVSKLLPLLNHDKNQRRDIWGKLWEIYSADQSLMVITSVVCSLLPMHKRDKTYNPIDDTVALQHPLMWKLIYDSLSQGLRNPSRKSLAKEDTRAKDNTVQADTQLLRRRALYIIDYLLQHDRDKEWQSYVAAFETLEMELEPHLIDQVWENARNLFSLSSKPSDSTSSRKSKFPPLTWDWLRLLLSRALVSPGSPSLRKLCMFRFLKGQAGILLPQANTASASKLKGSPTSIIPPDFIFDIVIPSYDTLESSVGLTMQNNDEKESLAELLVLFMQHYASEITANDLDCLVDLLWKRDTVCNLHCKTVVKLFSCISSSLVPETVVHVTDETMQSVIASMRELFSLGSIVDLYKKSLLDSLACILSHCKPKDKVDPLRILELLALFPLPEDSDGLCDGKDADSQSCANAMWTSLQGFSKSFDGFTISGTLATAYVDGQLLNSSISNAEWEPLKGSSDAELAIGRAVVLLCSLSSNTASELLWPAIYKGLNTVPHSTMQSSSASRMSRALLLLYNGCRLRLVSGIGNGGLIVDANSKHMIPPPASIETLLQNGIDFIIHHIEAVLSMTTEKAVSGTRSSSARQLSLLFERLSEQLSMIAEGFPSSISVSTTVDTALNANIKLLLDERRSVEITRPVCMIYSALRSGGSVNKPRDLALCRALLDVKFSVHRQSSKADEQALRSVFEFARLGSLSCVLTMMDDDPQQMDDRFLSLLKEIFEKGRDSVESAPANALGPLFQCVNKAGSACLKSIDSASYKSDFLEQISSTLFRIIAESPRSRDNVVLIDELCRLLFDSSLLVHEYEQYIQDSNAKTPILVAFRKLMTMAGTSRPQVSRVVLSRIISGWLGHLSDRAAVLAAVPYIDDIVRMLLQKDDTIDEAGTNQNKFLQDDKQSVVLPALTHEQSISRGMVLEFLTRLSTTGDRQKVLLRDLSNPIIMKLLAVVRPVGGRTCVMLGTEEYCKKIRGWQALCVMSRFVTEDIADEVSQTCFSAINEQIHGQIRYFVEVFILQCARKFPALFATMLLSQVSRHDLSPQTMSSLMVVAGNLTIGRYQDDFLPYLGNDLARDSFLSNILSASVPWLGSAQAFSRAIAQLLFYTLMPVVRGTASFDCGQDWSHKCLDTLYLHLRDNDDAIRLRKKQLQFFAGYELDSVCTSEGILSIPVDEGGESCPIHLVDAIKDCLRRATAELPDKMMSSNDEGGCEQSDEAEGASVFQRKIIPTDSLNLALEGIKERRMKNAALRKKQHLIVCASLIDKVPNLGGLARTSEIFAIDRLVIPDKKIVKMDSFAGLSVGAADWVEIEECKEKDVLRWLTKKKEEGYSVIGLEQTTSSIQLCDFSFPRRSILLLGKEKEGIPIGILNLVDQCVEIPQLGVIRSLNVHVSGAVAMWEYTKQNALSNRIPPANKSVI